MGFKSVYEDVLKKTKEKKQEYTRMYESLKKQGKLVQMVAEKDLKKLPSLLARDYLDFLSDAVCDYDGFTEDEQYEYSDEIELYMKYQDALGKRSRTLEVDIEWDELPAEAKLDFVNYK